MRHREYVLEEPVNHGFALDLPFDFRTVIMGNDTNWLI